MRERQERLVVRNLCLADQSRPSGLVEGIGGGGIEGGCAKGIVGGVELVDIGSSAACGRGASAALRRRQQVMTARTDIVNFKNGVVGQLALNAGGELVDDRRFNLLAIGCDGVADACQQAIGVTGGRLRPSGERVAKREARRRSQVPIVA